jgi:hypothetical protein
VTRVNLPAVVRCAVLLVAVYLAVDVATPLLPGAFRFDPRQSVEAAGRTGLPVVTPAPAVRSDRRPPAREDDPHPPALRSGLAPAVLLLPRVVHPFDRESSSSPSDDD